MQRALACRLFIIQFTYFYNTVYLFLRAISFISCVWPHTWVHLRVKEMCTQFSGASDGAHTKVEFLNACIKRFGEKDVMNEIKK